MNRLDRPNDDYYGNAEDRTGVYTNEGTSQKLQNSHKNIKPNKKRTEIRHQIEDTIAEKEKDDLADLGW